MKGRAGKSGGKAAAKGDKGGGKVRPGGCGRGGGGFVPAGDPASLCIASCSC